jgi:hypothetical protein
VSSSADAAPQGQQPAASYFTRDSDRQLIDERTPNGTYYYVEDANGSVVALTNSSGAVANRYSYDPWGPDDLKLWNCPRPLRLR